MRAIRFPFMLAMLCLLLVMAGGLAHADEGARPPSPGEDTVVEVKEGTPPVLMMTETPVVESEGTALDNLACHLAAYFFWQENCTIGPGFDRDGYYTMAVQRILQCQGYYRGAIDGIYGEQTISAVTRYQAVHGLPTAGVVGPRTWASLQSKLIETSRGYYSYFRVAGCSSSDFAMQYERGQFWGLWWLRKPNGVWVFMNIDWHTNPW